jgi:uncharacterized membrane protein YoaK (UPF0700 family)
VKDSERDALLLLLAAASGSADGWSYFGIAHAFVANMTGNTVLLGISIFHLHGDYIHPLIAVAGYVAGTALGTLLTRKVQPGSVWDRRVSSTLFLEGLVLIGAEVAWVAMRQQPSPRGASVLLAAIAVAIGMQSAAMMQLRVPGVVTTYITGTWTTLTHGLTLLIARQPRVEREKTKFEERFALQGTVLAVYFLSAVLTGWAFRHAAAVVGGIAAIAVLLAAGYGSLRNQRD